MEGGQQQQQQSSSDMNQEGGSSNGKSSSSSFMCSRQSSTRWTPTTEQIRILKELYYNNGVRSPTAEQIQRISAKLRQYGKIEGKNVFYWFQNHKARERQKKRFTADHHTKIITDRPHHQDHLLPHHRLSPIKFSASHYNLTPCPGNFPSSSTCSPAGLITHHVGNYGSIAMEKSFRECTINPSGNVDGQNIAWIGVDPYHHHNPFLENRKYTTNCDNNGKSTGARDFQTLEMAAAAEEEGGDQIETLPLFPMHGDLINNDYFSGCQCRGGGIDEDSSAGPMASLELTLNSHAARFSTS